MLWQEPIHDNFAEQVHAYSQRKAEQIEEEEKAAHNRAQQMWKTGDLRNISWIGKRRLDFESVWRCVQDTVKRLLVASFLRHSRYLQGRLKRLLDANRQRQAQPDCYKEAFSLWRSATRRFKRSRSCCKRSQSEIYRARKYDKFFVSARVL
jgi:hypothetical protein